MHIKEKSFRILSLNTGNIAVIKTDLIKPRSGAGGYISKWLHPGRTQGVTKGAF